MVNIQLYEIYAIKYAENPNSRRSHVFLGGDPLVMKRYRAPSNETQGIVVRLDVPPESETI